MFELPEFITLARQCNATLVGKTITAGGLGNSPHKFVWYNRSSEEFAALVKGRTVGEVQARAKWLFVPLNPGYMLLLGECGGRLLYHEPGTPLPPKYHLWFAFADGSSLSAMTQMWGGMELYEAGKEQERVGVKGMRPTPVDPEFTYDYFGRLIDEARAGQKRSVKGLLTQEALIPGLGNSIAQDIMFHAGLHPRRSLDDLSEAQRRVLYDATLATVREVIAQGGRCDEWDLYNRPGSYVRLMDNHAAGRPCPVCGTTVERIQYLGGACYFCPHCQV